MSITGHGRKKKAVIKAYWYEDEKCRNKIESETKMDVIGLAVKKRIGKRKRCIVCGGETKKIVYIAKS